MAHPLSNHCQDMVQHFLALRRADPAYARWALDAYADAPDCPCPNIKELVRDAHQRAPAQEAPGPGT